MFYDNDRTNFDPGYVKVNALVVKRPQSRKLYAGKGKQTARAAVSLASKG